MKNILIAILVSIPCLGFSQSKISGTVTYFYNDYQGNKADVGAAIYVTKDTLINYKLIDSVINGERYYRLYTNYKMDQIENDKLLKSAFVGKKKRAKMAIQIPEDVQKNVQNYGVETEDKFDSLDARAIREILKLDVFEDVYKTKADGVGNYSVNVKIPGQYYVIIRSANRHGHSMSSVTGNLYEEKVIIKDDDEKNVSNNFYLY